jgi:hypothetical protein
LYPTGSKFVELMRPSSKMSSAEGKNTTESGSLAAGTGV